MSLRCVIGLGANLGDRLAALESSVRELSAVGDIRSVSQLYETDPVGGPVQPDYFNAAVCLGVELTAAGLLRRLLAIETRHGRVRDSRWGPRNLDLDILWIEGFAANEPGLTVPHARLLERNFALIPLIEVAKDARDPNTGLAYSDSPLARDLSGMRLRGTRTPGLGSSLSPEGNIPLWSLSVEESQPRSGRPT